MTIEPMLIIAAYWVFSAIVGGMPEPDASASIWYRWGFSSLHILAGNISTAMQSRCQIKYPNSFQRITAQQPKVNPTAPILG